jgi:hypothetical protein
MVALLAPSTPLLHGEGRFPRTKRPPLRNRAELIWALHQTITNPDADAAAAKRAKDQLLRIVTAPGGPLRIVVPPLIGGRERRFTRQSRVPALAHSLS